MTQLRSLMLEEIQRRNFTESTRRAYLRIIEDFARYFNRAPDQLGPEQIREYIAHLISRQEALRQLGQSDCRSSAILLREDAEAALARGRNAVPEEANAFARDSEPGRGCPLNRICAQRFSPHHPDYPLRHRSAAGGVAHLKITDIDSERMVLHIQDGKGRKDRDVVLSPHLLRGTPTALPPAAPQTENVVVSRRTLAHRRLPDHRQGLLERLPRSSQPRRHSQSASSAYASSLLRHPPAGVWRRSAHHPGSPRPQRSAADLDLYSRLATAYQRYRQSPGCSPVCSRSPRNRWHGHRWRWPT